MDVEFSLNEEVRKHLEVFGATFYEEFDGCLQKASNIYNKLPRQLMHRYTRTPNDPIAFGEDPRQRFLGLLDEQVTLLGVITLTTGLKLGELAMGILDGLNRRRFRIAVMCPRAMYEEAACFKYYWKKASPLIGSMLSTPPSTFRLNRLRKLSMEPDALKKLFINKVIGVNAILRQWQFARRVDLSSPEALYRDHKLDKRHPVYQQSTLSALKTTEWEKGKRAEVFYALLCEATHPNCGASFLYVDFTSADSTSIQNLISKERNSQQIYEYVFALICTASIECVKLLDNFIAAADLERSKIEKFARKIRQVT
jgi:hypothetical protein